MSKEELKVVVGLYPLLDKKLLSELLTREDMFVLFDCFHEEVENWKASAQSAKNQLELLLGVKKTSTEFERLFKDLV